jgi:phosphatidylinositol alpha-1,6-mannosyltransferase
MIVGLFPELLGAGGIQRSGCLTALGLASFAAQGGERYRFLSLNDAAGAQSFKEGSAEIEFVGYARSKARFVLSALELALRQPTIVVGLHPSLAPVMAAMKIAAPGMRSVVVVHGEEVWKALPAVRRFAVRSADRVLAPSEDTLSRAIEEQRFFSGKGRKLAWSLGPEFDPHAVPIAAPLPPGFPRGRVILTVGRWEASEAYKGVDHLIAALPILLAKFSDVHLVAVGEGTDLPRLKSLAREAGVPSQVHFLPFMTRDQLPSAYDHCEIFAMPSRGEGFGLVFIEAMARAKPVIGGAHGGTPEIIDEGVDGYLVRHGDVAQLADRLGLLLAKDSLRQEMGAHALAKVRRDFTFARFSAKLAAILNEFVD